MGNIMKRVLVSLLATLCCACTLTGCSSNDVDDPTSIDNVSSGETRRSDTVQSDRLDVLPSGAVRAQFNPELLSRMEQCVNSAIDPAQARQISEDCFMSYPKHLANIFYARSVGELQVSASINEDNLATVELSAGGVKLGQFEAYPSPEIMQVKIVSFEQTEDLQRLGSQTIYRAAEAVLNK